MSICTLKIRELLSSLASLAFFLLEDEDFLDIGTEDVELSDPLSPSPLDQDHRQVIAVDDSPVDAEAVLMEGFPAHGAQMADWDQDV